MQTIQYFRTILACLALLVNPVHLYCQEDYNDIILLSPPEGMIIESVLPRFTWTSPGIDLFDENTLYQLKIVRVWEGQSFEEAMNANPPWVLETGISNNSHEFQIDALAMVTASPFNQYRPTVMEMEARLFRKEELMAVFAWQVSVTNEEGELADVSSNINTFNILTTYQHDGYPDIIFDIPSLTPLTMDLRELFPLLQTSQEVIFDGFCIADPAETFRVRYGEIGNYLPENISFDAGIVLFEDAEDELQGGFFSIEWRAGEELDISWTWDESEQSFSFPLQNMTMLAPTADGPILGIFSFTFLDLFGQPVYQDEFMVLLGCQ